MSYVPRSTSARLVVGEKHCILLEKMAKSIHIFLGFFFIVNFCLGTGFLGVPYAFFYSGYLAAIPTLIIISLVSWLNANYLLECMARAQAIVYFTKYSQPPTDSDSETDKPDTKLMNNSYEYETAIQHPKFEITLNRKFETVELCEMFFNKWIKYLYLIILSIYCFLASWSFTTVAGSAWALNIPFPFGSCMNLTDPFQHAVLPGLGAVTDLGCLYAYYFSLTMFAVIVIILSLIGLKEQVIIQMILGLLRFFTVGAIIIYSLAHIKKGRDACDFYAEEDIYPNENESTNFWYSLKNSTAYISYEDFALDFKATGWLTAIPVFAYAFILHQGIASLTHPIKQKKYLHWLIMAMFLTAGFCYLSLGIIVPLWFKASIQETCTLNFQQLTKPGNPLALRVLSYYLILFPSLDVVSAYPLITHCVVNNIYIIITGRDTSKASKLRYNWVLLGSLRFLVALLPILAAFGVANLIYILKYAGLFGFFICFFFPTALQLQSIRVCQNKFADIRKKYDISGSTKGNGEKKTLLSIQELKGKEKRGLYMTPYSRSWLSHPIAVGVIGVLGLCFFLLTIASLAVHPNKLTCETQ